MEVRSLPFPSVSFTPFLQHEKLLSRFSSGAYRKPHIFNRRHVFHFFKGSGGKLPHFPVHKGQGGFHADNHPLSAPGVVNA